MRHIHPGSCRLAKRSIHILATCLIAAAVLLSYSARAQSPGTGPITEAELAAMTPQSPNPYLALLPEGVAPDWKYWNAYASIHSPLKAEARRSRTHQTPTPVGEVEENNSITSAQILPNFGTGNLQTAAIDLFGNISEPSDPIFAGSPVEDDSSIPNATTVTLAPLERKRLNATIGNGPFGSAGTQTGDFDFFRIPAVGSGETLFAETNITHPFDGVDTLMAVYTADGQLLAFNDDEDVTVSLESKIAISVPFAGDYFVCVGSYIDPETEQRLLTDPFNGATGPGVGDEGPYEIILGRGDTDVDFFEVNFEAGDIFGFNAEGFASNISLLTETGFLLLGSSDDASFIYPPVSPLPGGNAAAGAYVIPDDGTYYIRAQGTDPGVYRLDLRVFRNSLETATDGARQILFIDFDGATIDTSIFGGPPGLRQLSPFSDFLANWGLPEVAENTTIDSILFAVEESLQEDLTLFSNNPLFNVEIRNSRDHPDPFGQPNVSRVIVGGTIAESGISTIGIAETIDPGNFDREESAIVLLDLLSAPPSNPNSLNGIPRSNFFSIIDVIGIGVGNIVAHEAGHFLGNFHTSNNFFTVRNIMDEGGSLENTLGVGNDGRIGTADDIDVDFGTDVYSFFEGFSGVEDTLNTTAFAMSSGFDPDIVYVDFNNPSSGTGLQASPFNNLTTAVAVANPGAEIRFIPSTGPASLQITKPLRLVNVNPLGGPVRIGVN